MEKKYLEAADKALAELKEILPSTYYKMLEVDFQLCKGNNDGFYAARMNSEISKMIFEGIVDKKSVDKLRRATETIKKLYTVEEWKEFNETRNVQAL